MTGIPQIRRDAGSVDGRKPAPNEDEKCLEFPCIMRYTVQAEKPAVRTARQTVFHEKAAFGRRETPKTKKNQKILYFC
jgi:hypothetical protein